MIAQEKPKVTKEWLANQIQKNPSFVIGRALLAIYKNQTSHEQANSTTRLQNGIGFSQPDARIGSIGARMFASKRALQQWCIDIWMKPAKDGYPRICKYAAQLEKISQSNN